MVLAETTLATAPIGLAIHGAIDRHQVRAARKLLGWSVSTLAKRSGRSYGVVSKLEAALPQRQRAGEDDTLLAVCLALERAGIVFTSEELPGVRLDQPLTPQQIMSARRILGWSASILAKKAGRTLGTVTRAEKGTLHCDLVPSVLASLRYTLRIAGVQFHEQGRCGMAEPSDYQT